MILRRLLSVCLRVPLWPILFSSLFLSCDSRLLVNPVHFCPHFAFDSFVVDVVTARSVPSSSPPLGCDARSDGSFPGKAGCCRLSEMSFGSRFG